MAGCCIMPLRCVPEQKVSDVPSVGHKDPSFRDASFEGPLSKGHVDQGKHRPNDASSKGCIVQGIKNPRLNVQGHIVRGYIVRFHPYFIPPLLPPLQRQNKTGGQKGRGGGWKGGWKWGGGGGHWACKTGDERVEQDTPPCYQIGFWNASRIEDRRRGLRWWLENVTVNSMLTKIVVYMGDKATQSSSFCFCRKVFVNHSWFFAKSCWLIQESFLKCFSNVFLKRGKSNFSENYFLKSCRSCPDIASTGWVAQYSFTLESLASSER